MKKLIAVFVSVLAVAPLAYAANQDKGTYELQLNGLIDPETFAGGRVDLDAGLGYFFADNVEGGGLLSFSDNDVIQTIGLSAFGELNVPTQGLAVVPYLGAGLGLLSVDLDGGDSQSALVGTVYAGAKYFITEDLAIAAQANIAVASEDVYGTDDGELDSTNLDITLALRYFFDR